MKSPDACQLVRESTARVASTATLCVIDDDAVARVVDEMSESTIDKLLSPREFDKDGMHFVDLDDADLTARYLLTVDAINFCFWPDHDAIGGTKRRAAMKDENVGGAGGSGGSGGGGGDGGGDGGGGGGGDGGDDAAAALATQGLEYEHVAGGLKRAVEMDRGVLDADRLARVDGGDVLKFSRTVIHFYKNCRFCFAKQPPFLFYLFFFNTSTHLIRRLL